MTRARVSRPSAFGSAGEPQIAAPTIPPDPVSLFGVRKHLASECVRLRLIGGDVAALSRRARAHSREIVARLHAAEELAAMALRQIAALTSPEVFEQGEPGAIRPGDVYRTSAEVRAEVAPSVGPLLRRTARVPPVRRHRTAYLAETRPRESA